MTVERNSVWDYVQPLSIDSLTKATGYFLGYMTCMFVVSRFFPSIEAKSPKKTYQLTGLYLFIVLSILIPLGYYTEYLSLLLIVENYLSFFIVINIFAITFSYYLFARSEAVQNAPNANRPIDYWHGREKDPMLFGVDLKVFFYQPSLIGLALINLSLAEAQN